MKIDEHNFIQQLLLKNEAALMYVIDEYSGLIKAVISKNMSCINEYQEECMNDVLLSIWTNISSYNQERNSFKNWIAAITKYKSIDYMRKYRKEYLELSYEENLFEEAVSKDEMSTILDDEISERTRELLDCLKETDRDIFMELYVEEASIDEISKKHNIKKPVLYSRISRAKKRIRIMEGMKKHE